MAQIQLEPGSLELLAAVKAGKVSRHRLRVPDGPETGQDYEHAPGRGPSDYRKATARLKPLKVKQLVHLRRGEATEVSWPWETTELGDTILDIAAKNPELESALAQVSDPATRLDIARTALITARRLARDRIAELENTLNSVLATFAQPAGPGQESLRASYITKDQLFAMREVLYRTEQEGHQ